MKRLLSAIVLALSAALTLSLAASPSWSQGYGPGPGKGYGPGPGAGKGYGPGPDRGPGGRGPRFAFGPNNTRGWNLMTPEERNAHRERMLSMRTVDECRAALDEHRKLVESRARERGVAAPRGPREDMCDIMKARGVIN